MAVDQQLLVQTGTHFVSTKKKKQSMLFYVNNVKPDNVLSNTYTHT